MTFEFEPFKNATEISIKESFEKHYRFLLGTRYDNFIKYSLSYMHKCIRVNTLKISVDELKQRLEPRWVLKQIPWCKEGFKIEHNSSTSDGKRFDIGNLPEHALGYIYIQESASMIPPIALMQDILYDSTYDYSDLFILDMCAAPGSKTSQLAQYMNNKGLLIANDVQHSRLKPLSSNLQRCGVLNTVVTHMRGQQFQEKKIMFDRILLDAPCSGVGTIRKSLSSIKTWSRSGIRKLNKIQKELIETAYNILKPGGVLVYSTCTLEPEENEEIVSWILNKYDDLYTESININIVKSEPIMAFEGKQYHKDCINCLRILPQDNDSEGFFVTRIRKKQNN